MTEKEWVDRLAIRLMQSFDSAYAWHKKGLSVDAILIQHDIIAAGAGVEKNIVKLHQRTIRLACEAVDAGVLFPVAHEAMTNELRHITATALQHRRKPKAKPKGNQ
jgi:hypothetical protein